MARTFERRLVEVAPEWDGDFPSADDIADRVLGAVEGEVRVLLEYDLAIAPQDGQFVPADHIAIEYLTLEIAVLADDNPVPALESSVESLLPTVDDGQMKIDAISFEPESPENSDQSTTSEDHAVGAPIAGDGGPHIPGGVSLSDPARFVDDEVTAVTDRGIVRVKLIAAEPTE